MTQAGRFLDPIAKAYIFFIQRRDALRGAGEEFNKIADVVSRQVIIIIFRVFIRVFLKRNFALSPKGSLF